MPISEVISSLQSFFFGVIGREIRVISVVPGESGWQAEFEVILEDEYMRLRGRKDLIAKYEALVAPNMTVVSYARKEIRERGSLE